MLSKEEYNSLKKIIEDAEGNRLPEKSDVEKAIAAGNHLMEFFYRGFDLYLRQREDVLNERNNELEEAVGESLFFDKETDFDRWFDVVNNYYYPAFIGLKDSELNYFDFEIFMALGRFTMFCERLVPYISICASYCVKLPEIVPEYKREISHIGMVMSAAFYLENLGKHIIYPMVSENASGSCDTLTALTFQRCMEYRKIAREMIADL